MTSGTLRDITPGIVDVLAHDKSEVASYDMGLWQRMQQEREMLARFITSRLNVAFPDDPASQSRALAVVLEAVSLDERVVFADQMRDELGDAAPYLGGLALDSINPDDLPPIGFGSEAA